MLARTAWRWERLNRNRLPLLGLKRVDVSDEILEDAFPKERCSCRMVQLTPILTSVCRTTVVL